jgi:CPA2 family monovalent cation:H+ antiporter-2
MVGVATLLAAAAAAHVVARWWSVPPLPLMVLAGIAVSLAAPVPESLVQDALVLGVSFLLFLAGLELDPRRLGAQRAAALRVGLTQFAVLALAGFGASTLLGFGAVESAYLALALTASSTLVGVRLLRRRQQMFEPFGRLVLGVLLVQDVLVLAALPGLTQVEAGWTAALGRLAAIAALGAASLGIRHWVVPLLRGLDDEEELVLLAPLAVLFAFLWATHLLELPLVAGAFLAGVALARFPVRSIVQTELAPVGDFFAALFFTALGALIQVPTVEQLQQAALLAGLVVVVTPPLVAIVGEWNGLSARSAVEAGLMLSQTSEISLVVGLAGMIQGHVSGGAFTVIALVTVVTMLITPALCTDRVAWRLVHLHPFRGRRLPGLPPSGHVVLLGCGATGRAVLEALLTGGAAVTVVEDDPAVAGELGRAGIRVVRGDGSDPAVLAEAGVARARLVLSTLRRVDDNATALALVPENVPVVVRVFDEAEGEWVRSRGGEPVVTSRLAVPPLLAWYDENREALDRSAAARAG